MLVFIDESGCPGFKFARGSAEMFGIGMVIFNNGEEAQLTEEAIRAVRQQLCHKPEFKFSKSRDEVRDAFFRAVARCPFRVRALIVRKKSLNSRHLQTDPDDFYSYFTKMLMKHDDGALNAAKVRIDGSGSQEFQRALGSYLRRELGQRIKDLKMADSSRDQLMQLADMCIGAIMRAQRTDREKPDRWRQMLAPRIADVWHFR